MDVEFPQLFSPRNHVSSLGIHSLDLVHTFQVRYLHPVQTHVQLRVGKNSDRNPAKRGVKILYNIIDVHAIEKRVASLFEIRLLTVRCLIRHKLNIL